MSLFVQKPSVLSRHFGLQRWVVAATCALLAGGAPPLALSQPLAGAALPDLGDGSTLSTAQERRIGDRIMRDLYRDPAYLDDPVLMDYVQTLWQPLLQASRVIGNLNPELEERYAWKIFLLRERTVNAFALPGGYMGLHLGLLAMVDSRDELTSVLAHELGHVTQRHIARMLDKSSQQAPWMIGAMILGVLAASRNPDAGSALLVGGQAAGVQAQLNFSRDMEREADRIGLAVDTQAGYVPQGFVAMFDKLQQEARLNDSGDFPFLRTHPLTTERVADMQGRMPSGPVRRNPASMQLIDVLMAARAKVLMSPNVATQQTWQTLSEAAELASKPWKQRLATHYGAALAAMQVHDVPRARQALARLHAALAQAHQAQPDLVDGSVRQQVNWLDAEIQLAAHDLTLQEQSRLALLLAEAPTQSAQLRRPVLLMRAQLALQIGQPAGLNRAAQDIQGWLAQHGSDALAWQTLSQLHEAQRLPLRALRDAAEAQMAMQHYDAALDRLRAAQDLMRQLGAKASAADQIDASIIDTRFRQVTALVKEQAKER